MHRTITSLLNLPVMSLHTGSRLAITSGVIIDPRKLTIAAFYVEGAMVSSPAVLHPIDIREIGELGFIVDNDTKLMSLDGLVRLEEIIDFRCELIGLRVIDEDGRKLGKVSGYSIETEGYTIQQITTEQSLFRSFTSTGNTIHRSQIVSVSRQGILVKSTRISQAIQDASVPSHSFANPFRAGSSQPEGSDTISPS